MSTFWKLVWFITILGLDIARIFLTHGIDVPALIFGVVAVLPAFPYFAKSMELDAPKGRVKIEAMEVEKTAKQIEDKPEPAIPPPAPNPSAIDASYRILPSDTPGGGPTLGFLVDPAAITSKTKVNYYEADPNIALVNLRIEIEKRLAVLAQMYGLKYPAPLSRIVQELQQRQVLDPRSTEPLLAMIKYGNEAAHGAAVAPEVAQVANRIEPVILAELDFVIRKARESR